MHHVRGVAEQHGARPHILQGVLQLERETRRRRRRVRISPRPRRRPRSGPRRNLTSRARRRAASWTASALHTMDERPSAAAKRPAVRWSRTAATRCCCGLCGAHMRHQRVLVIGMAGGVDAEQLLGSSESCSVGCRDQQLGAQDASVAQSESRRSRSARRCACYRASINTRPRYAPPAGIAIAERLAVHDDSRDWARRFPRSRRSANPCPALPAGIPDAHAFVREHPGAGQ